MRLFIAVNFSDEVKTQLLSVQSVLRRQSVSGNFSRPENLHLTLVFLGEIPAGRVAGIQAVMDFVRSTALDIKLEGVGKFRGGDGDTWWVGIRNGPGLSGLHRQLAEGLQGAGFAVESRPFKPHLTLGREIILKPDADVSETGSFPGVLAQVQSIHLMRSERIQGKLTYTAIYERKLL